MSSTPHVIHQAQARELLAQVDVVQILRTLFHDLATGQAVQPAQQWVEFPHAAGDFINAPRAHEVPPQCLNAMQVFCDYRQTTPGSAGEMLIAAEQHGWERRAIVGGLPELLSERVQRPTYDRHVFFRSIGLGLEDIALANALWRQL